uniref:DUF413 domain-containing protein n=1 Tax=Thaumasiovibrio occultus TaxID=1891184 RepID=UPI00131CB41C|nr:DUF413 domain-containing protein [Thaumasiovibrio occultus]
MRSEGLFFDPKFFPRGFGKSGNFTIAEAQRLEMFGIRMRRLASGEVSPEDAEEQAFLAQINGEEAITTPEAQVWMKYMRLTTQRKQSFTLCSTPSKVGAGMDDDDDSSSDDD